MRGGGVQWLFGQCPNELLYFCVGASLTHIYKVEACISVYQAIIVQCTLYNVQVTIAQFVIPLMVAAIANTAIYRRLKVDLSPQNIFPKHIFPKRIFPKYFLCLNLGFVRVK